MSEEFNMEAAESAALLRHSGSESTIRVEQSTNFTESFCKRKVGGYLRCFLRDVVWNNGVFCSVMAAVLHSLEPIFVKSLPRTSPFVLAMLRSCIALPSTLILMRLTGNRRPWNSIRSLPWLMLRGITGCATMVFLFSGQRLVPLTVCQTIFMVHPAFICILAYLLLGEQMTWMQCLGVTMSLIGAVVVVHPPMLFGGEWNAPLLGVVFLLAAAMSVTATILLIRVVADVESTLAMTLWLHLVDIMVCIPPLVMGWPQPAALEFSMSGWLTLLAVGLCTFSSQMFLNRGCQLLPAATSGTIGTMQVPLAYTWGVMLFHEQGSVMGSLGTVVVVAGLIIVSRSQQGAGRIARVVGQPNNKMSVSTESDAAHDITNGGASHHTL